MGYALIDNLHKGYFDLIKAIKSDESIKYLLDKYNINLNDYWILKKSNRFRLIEIDEIYNYAGIICFRKDIFNKEDIERWLDWYNGFDYRLTFLSKPFPPIEMIDKINVIEWDTN